MRGLTLLITLALATLPFQGRAADVAAGMAKAEACAACHGANGVSVSADIPNLAGQKEDYLAAQLSAFKQGKRQNAIMNAIAEQLSETDIADLAAFWNGLPAAGGAQSSPLIAAINKTRVTFPTAYRDSFTHYTTINFPDRKQVRRYYANAEAVAAAREGRPIGEGAVFLVEAYKARLDAAGQPVTGADGFFEAEALAFYTAMQSGPRWGDDIPELYRNGDWNYAVFGAGEELKTSVNQAKCLACHKPLAADSYIFSLEQLVAAVE